MHSNASIHNVVMFNFLNSIASSKVNTYEITLNTLHDETETHYLFSLRRDNISGETSFTGKNR